MTDKMITALSTHLMGRKGFSGPLANTESGISGGWSMSQRRGHRR
jgi:hypothetical protein